MFTFKKFAVVSVAALTAVLSISCGDDKEDEGGEYKDLVVKNFTLSYADKSYGDIDAGQNYKETDAKAKAGDIDVVAYYTSGASSDVINPCIIAVDEIADNCGDPELYPVPPKYNSQLANLKGKTTEDIKGFLYDFGNDVIDTDTEETKISISKGSAFIVFTTKQKYFVVVMTDTGAESVSLDFTGTGLQ